MKLFSYFDDWISSYIHFHKSLEFPYVWVIPLLELILLFVIAYYVNYFIPRGKWRQE